MQNAATRDELAPTALIEQILSKAARKIASTFDTIPDNVRRQVPGLPAEAVALIAAEVGKVRRIVSAMSLADVDDGSTGGRGADR